MTDYVDSLIPVKYHYNKDVFPKEHTEFENMAGLESYDFNPVATTLLKEARAKADGK